VTPQRFRLRPAYPWLPWALGGFGVLCIVFGWLAGVGPRTRWTETAAGAVLVALALWYLRSPLWRSAVEVDDRGLRVVGPRGVRLELPWREVVRVRWARADQTCYIDAGMADKSFLVPGPGVAAPYRIEGRAALCDLVRAACGERVEEVAELAPPRPGKAAP